MTSAQKATEPSLEAVLPAHEGLMRSVELIREYDSFVLVSHVNPDGDALGSELALARALLDRDFDVIVTNHDEPPFRYRNLPDVDLITTDPVRVSEDQLVIVIECPGFHRLGDVLDLEQIRSTGTHVLNIDHHPDNELYGDVNYLDTNAPATGMMVLHILDELGWTFGPSVASNLYTTILTDTGSFQHSNTTAETFEMAARLVRAGADSHALAADIYQVTKLRRLRLLSKVLDTLTLSSDGKIAELSVTQSMMASVGADGSDTEGFVDYARMVEGTAIGVLFREQDEQTVKLSFRSRGEQDVQKLAKVFGGGGHPNAAGAVVSSDLESIRRRVRQRIKDQFGYG